MVPEGMLRCRRYAPRPERMSEAAAAELVTWPMVAPEDWCGEFLERDPGDVDADPLAGFTRGGPGEDEE